MRQLRQRCLSATTSAPVRADDRCLGASQGALVIGSTHPAAAVTVDGRNVRVAPDGSFVFGIGRDAQR